MIKNNIRKNKLILFVLILLVSFLLFFLSYKTKNFQIFILSITIFSILIFFVKKIKKNSIIPFFSLLLILTIIETSLFIVNGKLSIGKKENGKNQIIHVKNKKTILGHQPLEGVQNHKIFKNNELVFDKYYTILSNNYRLTPRTNNNIKKNVINFFGGSITFGWGLDDDETLPFLTQQYFTNSKINNYAISGYGAHQVFTQITKLENFIGDINIFVTFKNHIPRSSCKRDFSLGTPRYILNKDNKIEQKGFCGSINVGKFRLPDIIYKVLKKSEIKILIDKIYLRKYLFDKESLDLYLVLIKEINSYLNNQKKEFIVAYISYNEEIDDIILDYFKTHNINFIDLTLDRKNNENFIPNDGHPSKKANLKRAKIISKFLKNLN